MKRAAAWGWLWSWLVFWQPLAATIVLVVN